MLSALSDAEWIPISLHYLRSWEFSRISVGIPFVVLTIAIVWQYKKWRFNDIRQEAIARMAREAGGQEFTWNELGAGDYLYRSMVQMARQANINTPRMFWCSLDIDNAFTFSTKKENAIVIFDKVVRDPMLAPFATATVAHEIGHIVNKDCKTDWILDLIVDTFGFAFVKGNEFYRKRTRECLIFRSSDTPIYIAILNAGLFLALGVIMMLVGFIPWSCAKGLLWWKSYTAEYMADGIGAKLLSDPMLMPDGMIMSHIRMQGSLNLHNCMDVHPPDVGRVRRFMPQFNGDWKAACRDVIQRRRLCIN
jgi:Zn-dependent protease with chaperone function